MVGFVEKIGFKMGVKETVSYRRWKRSSQGSRSNGSRERKIRGGVSTCLHKLMLHRTLYDIKSGSNNGHTMSKLANLSVTVKNMTISCTNLMTLTRAMSRHWLTYCQHM